MSARRLADMTEWGKRRERHVKERDKAMSERNDERTGGPPALPDGAVEALRWQDARSNWSACDDKGGEWLWFEKPTPGRWERCAGTSDAARRLAAELAACRARRDEGVGEPVNLDLAYGLVQAAEGEYRKAQLAVAALPPESSSEEYARVYAAERKAEMGLLRARMIHLEALDRLLTARRATATPATPAGEETTR